jgi:hypothetical protein
MIKILTLTIILLFGCSILIAGAGEDWSNWYNIENPFGASWIDRDYVKVISDRNGNINLFVLDPVEKRVWHKSLAERQFYAYECEKVMVSESIFKRLKKYACDPLYWSEKEDSKPEICKEDYWDKEGGRFWQRCYLSPDQKRPLWSEWDSIGEWNTDKSSINSFNGLEVAINREGEIEIFTKDDLGQIWHLKQITLEGKWGNWEIFGIPTGATAINSTISIGKNRDGRLKLFVSDVNDIIWEISQITPSGKWGTWNSLGTPAVTDPIAESIPGLLILENKDGRLELLAFSGVPADYRFFYTYPWAISQKTPNGKWESWKKFGSPHFIYYPLVAHTRNENGKLEVFSMTKSPETGRIAVQHREQVSANGGWNDWKFFVQTPFEFHIDHSERPNLAVTRRGDGKSSFFVNSQKNEIWNVTQITPSGSYGKWQSLGSPPIVGYWFVQIILAITNRKGNEEVITICSDGISYSIWHTRRE